MEQVTRATIMEKREQHECGAMRVWSNASNEYGATRAARVWSNASVEQREQREQRVARLWSNASVETRAMSMEQREQLIIINNSYNIPEYNNQ